MNTKTCAKCGHQFEGEEILCSICGAEIQKNNESLEKQVADVKEGISINASNLQVDSDLNKQIENKNVVDITEDKEEDIVITGGINVDENTIPKKVTDKKTY